MKHKKLLSMLLAIVIVLSSLTAGFSVFAKDSNDFADEAAAFKTTEFVRPDNSEVAWTVGGIQTAANELWKLIAETVVPLIAKDVDISNGFDKILAENVYTNEMVGSIFDLLATLSQDYDTIVVEDMGLSLGALVQIVFMPDIYVGGLFGDTLLPEAKYANFIELLQKHLCYGSPEGTELPALAEEEFKNGTFGFQDGDREGFIDAVLAVLRPLTTLLAPGGSVMGMISLDVNMFDYTDGEGNEVQGIYSNLIPLLEQLGCNDLMTAEEYKANYEAVLAASGTGVAADELVKPIINSMIKNVLDVVSPDPMNGLIKILPRLAYVISTDLLNDSVKAALAQAGKISALANSVDLSVESINKILATPIEVNDTTTIKLAPIDWMKLADCATVEVVKSASNTNEYVMVRTGEVESCFSTVMYYVYDVAFADADNYAAIKSLITSLIPGSLSGMVTGYTDNWVEIGKVATYGEILNMLVPDPQGDPIEKPGTDDPNVDEPDDNQPGTDDPDNNKPGTDNPSENPSDNNNNNNNNGNGNTATNNNKSNVKSPSIPKTGTEQATYYTLSAVLATAGIAIIATALVSLKKKKVTE